jgi:hypothetical protein
VNGQAIRKVSRAAALAGLALFLASGTAVASLVLVLDRDSGPPGTRVTGRTGGNGAFATTVDPVATYLVERPAADHVTSPNDTHLIRIGRLIVDAARNGRITFIVPRVDPGSYVVMVRCRSCAQFSAGRTMIPVASFRVTSPLPATDVEPAHPVRGDTSMAAIGSGVVGTAMVVVSLRRRTRSVGTDRRAVGGPTQLPRIER